MKEVELNFPMYALLKIREGVYCDAAYHLIIMGADMNAFSTSPSTAYKINNKEEYDFIKSLNIEVVEL